MRYLVDTNVLSEQRKRVPNPGVIAWFGQAEADHTYLSAITVGEIRRGIRKLELRRDHRQAAALEEWLTETRRLFTDRIVAVTAEVAERWGHHTAARPLPVTDGLIGATALVHDWTLVTRNVRDFAHLGVRLHDPFTA